MDRTELVIVTNEVVEQAVELLQDDIYKIYLYGSYARGDFDSESDVDIILSYAELNTPLVFLMLAVNLHGIDPIRKWIC